MSIITPCYNAERFIAQAIESVLAQTYTDWEMLIVDDCSTDNSADIIKEYEERDCRIKYFKTDKPSGSPALPRNIAIENATGRYIAFLDSDDLWLPEKLEQQIPLFENESVAVVFSNYEKIKENGERSHRIVKAPARVDYKELLKGNVIGNLTGVYDTGKVGVISNKDIANEDYVLWLSILKRGYIAMNTETVEGLYRVTKGSVSSNKLRCFCWQWQILRKVEQIKLSKTIYLIGVYFIKGVKKFLK